MALRKTRMENWYEFYKGETCPICHKTGGCMINKKGEAVACIRVQSPTVFSTRFQSWIHVLDQRKKIDQVDESNHTTHKKHQDGILDVVYRGYLHELTLEDSHRGDLLNRGFTDNELQLRGYKSLPEKSWEITKRMQTRMGLKHFKGIPGFFKTKYSWAIKGNHGFLVPYRNEFNQIVGFQYRLDNPEVKYKYVWLSSANEDEGTAIGDPLPVHIALPLHELVEREQNHEKSQMISTIKKEAVWITEGGLKADLVADGLQKYMIPEYKEFLGTTVCGISGVNAWAYVLPKLEAMGVKRVTFAIDMDVLENPQVTQAFNNMVQSLEEKNYEVYMAVWDISKGKGLDDLFKNKEIPTIGKMTK